MSYRITAAPAAANNTTAASAAVNNEAAAPAAANNGVNTKITKTYDPLKTFHNEYFSPDYIKNNPLLIFITSPDNKFEHLTVYTIIRRQYQAEADALQRKLLSMGRGELISASI